MVVVLGVSGESGAVAMWWQVMTVPRDGQRQDSRQQLGEPRSGSRIATGTRRPQASSLVVVLLAHQAEAESMLACIIFVVAAAAGGIARRWMEGCRSMSWWAGSRLQYSLWLGRDSRCWLGCLPLARYDSTGNYCCMYARAFLRRRTTHHRPAVATPICPYHHHYQ